MSNETYTIEVMSPLLRPGITIRTEVSKTYLAEAVRDLMETVRRINDEERPVPNYARSIILEPDRPRGAIRDSMINTNINTRG